MAQQPQPDSSNSTLSTGTLVGLLFTGAMLGVGIFAAVVAAFDTIRDKTHLSWSAELVTFALICFLFAMLATALGCYLFAHLITAMAKQMAVVSTIQRVPEAVRPPEPVQVHPWMLQEPPSSITEHTTHLIEPSMRTLQ